MNTLLERFPRVAGLEEFVALPARNDKTPVLSHSDIKLSDHSRFAEIRSWLAGTHKNIQAGQVWENINPEEGDEFGLRQILVQSFQNGLATVIGVNSNGNGSTRGQGEVSEMIMDDFTQTGENRGWRLISFTAPLTPTGHVENGYTLPTPVKPVKPTAPVTRVQTATNNKAQSQSSSAPVVTNVKLIEEKKVAPVKPRVTTTSSKNTLFNNVTEKIQNSFGKKS